MFQPLFFLLYAMHSFLKSMFPIHACFLAAGPAAKAEEQEEPAWPVDDADEAPHYEIEEGYEDGGGGSSPCRESMGGGRE